MRQLDRPDDQQPLPPPIRKPAPGPAPVPGRPNWFTNRPGGEPFYAEPVKPKSEAAKMWAAFVAAGCRMYGKSP